MRSSIDLRKILSSFYMSDFVENHKVRTVLKNLKFFTVRQGEQDYMYY